MRIHGAYRLDNLTTEAKNKGNGSCQEGNRGSVPLKAARREGNADSVPAVASPDNGNARSVPILTASHNGNGTAVPNLAPRNGTVARHKEGNGAAVA